METSVDEIRGQARAASNVYAMLARAFTLEWVADSVFGIAEVAQALGVPWPKESNSELIRAQYVDRFIVPSAAAYVPLSENCIRTAAEQNGNLVFGQVDGPHREHVSRCYAAAGFVRPACLTHDDSFAAELYFMSYLAAVQADAQDEGVAENALLWQRRFLSDHLGIWAKKGAIALARTGDDFYTRTANLAAAWCEIDAERVGLGAA